MEFWNKEDNLTVLEVPSRRILQHALEEMHGPLARDVVGHDNGQGRILIEAASEQVVHIDVASRPKLDNDVT